MKNKGITLIALVITVIILLILAGISISVLTGSGLFGKAQEATRLSEIKEIEEAARISYMERQIDEIDRGNKAEVEGIIRDLREKGYTIKEVTGGTNSVTGVKLDKSEISMGTNTTEEITYEYEYASGTTVRYFAEVEGKNYEIIFNNGEITVSTLETDLKNINKLPEVTVSSSNGEIVEAQKTEEGKITLTSKNKGGEVTITVTCAGNPVTCKITIDLFIGIDKTKTDPTGALPNSQVKVVEDDASKGIVIETTNGATTIQWVWIEVPKTEFTTVAALKEEKAEEEIIEEELNAAIKTDLIRYAGVYRNSPRNSVGEWIDTWYSGCGIDKPETYTAMYNKMINSVYNNGGFWIQRYEDETVNITCGNAQIKASGYSPDSTKTSSLLFGIQWDLVCKYLQVKGGLSEAQINSDSSSWGNYKNAGKTPKTDDTKKMNIYDFAGNLWEWTLEKTTNSSGPCSTRGSGYDRTGSDYPASYRYLNTTNITHALISFRATFY